MLCANGAVYLSVHLLVRLCTGKLKKLWVDWDQVIRLSLYWVYLEMIKFWAQWKRGPQNT